MKIWKSLSALVLGLAICSLAGSQPPSPGAAEDTKRIDGLVKQLGSVRYVEREQAQKELEAIGAPALEVLRKAVKEGDPEISKRAADMVRRLEDKINTDKLLAPKMVKLSLKEVPVAEAVAQLAKQSGYVVTLENPAALANRKITLETGEVSFFQALDKLCAKAGLIEKAQVGPTFGPNPPPFIRPNFRIGPGGVIPGVVPGIAPLPPQIIPNGVQPKVPVPEAKPVQPKLPAVQAPLDGQLQLGRLGQPDQAIKALEARLKALEERMEVQIAQEVAKNLERLAQAQAQAQAQIQALPPIQIQPFPVPQFGPLQRPGFGPAQQPRQFILADGKPTEYPTSYFGAVRVRLLPGATTNMKAQPGEALLIFEVTAEPRLQNFQVTSAPSIVRALDSEGQLLATLEQPGNNPNVQAPVPNFQFPNPFNNPLATQQQRTFPVRLKLGEKQAKLLKELSGTMTVSVQLPSEPVATIDNVLKAAGQTAKHKDKGNVVLTLQTIEKLGNNGYKVQMVLENNDANAQNPFGGVGGIQIIGNGQIQIGGFGVGPGFNQDLPALLDANGKAYKIAQVPQSAMQFGNGAFKRTVTVEYRANEGQGAPTQLVVSEARNTTLAVPFGFKNVPIE